jgi:hypothetical protein
MYKLLFILLLFTSSYAQDTCWVDPFLIDNYTIVDDEGYVWQEPAKPKLFTYSGFHVGTFYRFGYVENDLLATVKTGIAIREKTNLSIQVNMSFKSSQVYYKLGIERRLF